MDFAKRAYDQSFHQDPVIRSLLDVDIYKLIMAQWIHANHPNVPVTFTVINRTKSLRVTNLVDEHSLREQLNHCRKLRFTKSELIWLTGNTFFGTERIFSPEFISFLRDFSLPEYDLRKREDGQYDLSFSGPWIAVTLWETIAMTVLNTMLNRARMEKMSQFELERLYTKAKTTLFDNLDSLVGIPNISDFGTRRRHDFLWQEFALLAAKEILGTGLKGTSNAYLAMKHGIEAVGSNAHETRMVLACLAETDEDLLTSPYRFDASWQDLYGGNLRMMLPDTFGSTGYLKNAPSFLHKWKGIRIDSKDPFVAGEEAIAWWESVGEDPREKLLLQSDGLTAGNIRALYERFNGRVGIGFGWGTNLTNAFPDPLKAISLVCKVTEANGRPAVKLSDVRSKRTGDVREVERYVRVFGEAGTVSGEEPKV